MAVIDCFKQIKDGGSIEKNKRVEKVNKKKTDWKIDKQTDRYTDMRAGRQAGNQ